MNSSCSRMNREQLFDWIHMISFAVVETALYLDTHPDDMEALKFYQECVEMKNTAMKEYSTRFTPLTLALTGNSQTKWDWVLSPWPWEGGNC
ncbi:MAG: spore coat protein CotJB [Lachnospiraceae bacterium]|nr:spore coat protein CotJB [Lachnospiraceae bacterium]